MKSTRSKVLPALCAAIAVFGFAWAPLRGGEGNRSDIDRGFRCLYNFDFDGADRLMDAHIDKHPGDPGAYCLKAAVCLFSELHRLRVLEAEFFEDDKKIIAEQSLKPDPELKKRFDEAIAEADRAARARLAKDPNDTDALFALVMSTGMVTDYKALVEKRRLGSLKYVKDSTNSAMRLLEVDPNYADAYVSRGVAEYLIGSLPFFVKWFVRIDDVGGDKAVAMKNLKLAAAKGKHLGPLARIMLAILNLREKRPELARDYLQGLAKEFPENPLFRKELAKLQVRLADGTEASQ